MFDMKITLSQQNVETAIQEYLITQGLNFKGFEVNFINGRMGKGLVADVTLKPTSISAAVPAPSPSLVEALNEPTSCEELDEVHSTEEAEEDHSEASEETPAVPKKSLFGA